MQPKLRVLLRSLLPMFIDEHAPFLSVFKSERFPHSQLHFTYTALSEVVFKMKPLLTGGGQGTSMQEQKVLQRL